MTVKRSRSGLFSLGVLLMAAVLAACGAEPTTPTPKTDAGTEDPADPCLTNNGGCDEHATCTSLDGAALCACQPGYTGSGKSCVDVDECTAGTDNCEDGTTCVNTPVTFCT